MADPEKDGLKPLRGVQSDGLTANKLQMADPEKDGLKPNKTFTINALVTTFKWLIQRKMD